MTIKKYISNYFLMIQLNWGNITGLYILTNRMEKLIPGNKLIDQDAFPNVYKYVKIRLNKQMNINQYAVLLGMH